MLNNYRKRVFLVFFQDQHLAFVSRRCMSNLPIAHGRHVISKICNKKRIGANIRPHLLSIFALHESDFCEKFLCVMRRVEGEWLNDSICFDWAKTQKQTFSQGFIQTYAAWEWVHVVVNIKPIHIFTRSILIFVQGHLAKVDVIDFNFFNAHKEKMKAAR